jgi:outer membrane protein assembly factor BamB
VNARILVRLTLVLAAALLLGACGGGGSRLRLFSTDWMDDRGQSIGDVHARLRGVPLRGDIDLAVAVAGKGDKIVAAPLGGGPTWSFSHALDTRPILAGGVVVASGGGEVFALDAKSGKKLWARPSGAAPLLGAGDDGNVTALTFSNGKGSSVLVVSRDGAVKRQIETDKAIGAPAVVAGIVFVPWGDQYVSAIDATTGDEIGRATLRDKVSRAQTIGDALYFGELAYVRFDENIRLASGGGASRAGVPSRELPGTPRLLAPGTETVPAVANARDRDRLFARPSGAQGPLGIDSQRFYASYFRLVLGFDSEKGELAWVHTHPRDVIGGEAVSGGLALCDEQGNVFVLSAKDGREATKGSFGEPIKSCTVRADTLQVAAPAGESPPLAQQVAEAVSNKEASLATAQRLLLRELATLEDESATKTLVEIASDPRSAPVLVTDARAGLASRRNGAQHMLAALERHYDFMGDVLVTPPVGPMADALAAMKETRAAPLLAAHLLDPANTDEDVRRAAAALATLATKAEVPKLRQFFAMYRGTAQTEDVALAVARVGEALLAADAKEGRALVEAAAKDPMTVDVAQKRLQALLAASPGEKGNPKKPDARKPDAPEDKAAGKK